MDNKKEGYTSRLKKKYRDEIVDEMVKAFGYGNKMAVPKITKIVLNIGVGEAVRNAKALDFATSDLMSITGQKPVVTKAKKSIAGFKLRAGMPIGCKVTMRGNRMYDFFDRLVNVALPRVRDFKGVSLKSFDGYGNYSMGISEQVVFPEINYDKIDKIRGLEITITTTAKTDEECMKLLKLMGMPFREH